MITVYSSTLIRTWTQRLLQFRVNVDHSVSDLGPSDVCVHGTRSPRAVRITRHLRHADPTDGLQWPREKRMDLVDKY